MTYYTETVHYYECDRCGETEHDCYSSSLPYGWSKDQGNHYCEWCTRKMESQAAIAGNELEWWMLNNGLL